MVQTEEKTKVLTLGQVIEHRCMAQCFEALEGTYRRIIWTLDGETGKLILAAYADGIGSDEIDAPLLCAPTHGWEPYDCQNRTRATRPEEDCPGCPLAEENAA